MLEWMIFWGVSSKCILWRCWFTQMSGGINLEDFGKWVDIFLVMLTSCHMTNLHNVSFETWMLMKSHVSQRLVILNMTQTTPSKRWLDSTPSFFCGLDCFLEF